MVSSVGPALQTRLRHHTTEAIEVMCGERGSHFDPDLLDRFLDAMDEVETIRRSWQDESVLTG